MVFKAIAFEPKGWLYDLRESLRTAVGQLTVDDDSILNATYSSPINELCDVENVLFYNIGTGAFRSACQNGFYWSAVLQKFYRRLSGWKTIRIIKSMNLKLKPAPCKLGNKKYPCRVG